MSRLLEYIYKNITNPEINSLSSIFISHLENNCEDSHLSHIELYYLSNIYFYNKNYSRALEYIDRFRREYTIQKILHDDETLSRVDSIRSSCIDNIYTVYAEYNIDNVLNIVRNGIVNNDSDVTVTITTCKRYSLFYKTINSFINSCTDLYRVKRWIVVDDNSTREDRILMRKNFPFLEFILKEESEKGHYISMNMIKDSIDTEYFFHLEDDWVFFVKDNYLTKCIEILNIDNSYGQCLINKNYGERGQCVDISGGYLNIHNDIVYYIHEYYKGDTLIEKSNNGKKNCYYWPNFSFRVGMNRKSVVDRIGYFSKNLHFEMEYASRYTEMGYKTTFLDSIYCYHIGRCTFERHDSEKKNAYDLNSTEQFVTNNHEKAREQGGDKTVLGLTSEEEKIYPYYNPKSKNYTIRSIVINLEHRIDRKKEFIVNNHDQLYNLEYMFFQGVDGKSIVPTPKILKLFENGDYNYRRGIVGCALSHMALWTDLSNREEEVFLIMEDDITLASGFQNKLKIVMDRLSHCDWDICFLGHFLYPEYRDSNVFADGVPDIQKWSIDECMRKSMGGTIGYLINSRGAKNMISEIVNKGVYNAIDWVMFKTANKNSIYYCYPHIVFSQCAENNKKVDSDIQYDNNSIVEKSRLYSEILYWKNIVNSRGINYQCVDRMNLDFIDDKNSKIIFTDKNQNRDTLLSSICIVKNTEPIDCKNLPIYVYGFSDYTVYIPFTKINDSILPDLPL